MREASTKTGIGTAAASLIRAAVIGAWAFLLPFFGGLVGLWLEMRGQRNVVFEDAAEQQTWPTIGFAAKVAAAHAAAGAVCAVVAVALTWWLRARRRRLVAVSLFVVIVGYAFARDVIQRPVFYEPLLYRGGTVPRAFMTVLTDHLPLAVLDSVALGLFTLLLVVGGVRHRSSPRFRRGVIAASSLLTVGVLVAFTSVITGGSRSESSRVDAVAGGPFNIILIGSDSLRADRLSALGSTRPCLPRIDALAENGVVFRDAYVPLARTLPSIASLLTGCDPHTHGIRHMFPPRKHRAIRRPTLPALLRKHGYRSEVITDYAGEMFNLVDLGFDHVSAPPAFSLSSLVKSQIIKYAPAFLPFFNHGPGHHLFPVLRFLPTNADPRWLADRVIERFDALDTDQPFLLTAFFSTTHTPYSVPYPGYQTYAAPGYQGPNKYAFYVRSLEMMKDLERPLPDVEVQQIRALYDGSGHMVDAAVGRVVDEVKRRGLWDRTLIIIFSDHGEHLYEPGNTSDHGKWFRGMRRTASRSCSPAGPWRDGGASSMASSVRRMCCRRSCHYSGAKCRRASTAGISGSRLRVRSAADCRCSARPGSGSMRRRRFNRRPTR